MTTESKPAALIIGLDVGRGYVIACPYSPSADLAEFIRKYKPVKALATEAGLKKILELGEVFALEPTGRDHRWWVEHLDAAGKLVLLVSGLRVRNHARDRGVVSKGDKEDAAAIASYAAMHLDNGNSKAFLSLNDRGSRIRELRHQILSCQHQTTKLINQLKARLAVEAPDCCKFTVNERDWGRPPSRQWQKLLKDERLSWLSRDDLEFIIKLEERESKLECALSEILDPIQEFRSVWEQWRFNERQIAAIVGALDPIEQFMGERGALISHTITKDGKRIKINHTLRGIQRCLGYGRVKYQSGDSWKWARTGDQSVLSALYLWIDVRVAVGRCLNRNRLFKQLGKPPEWESWKEKEQQKWLASHSFRSLCEQWDSKVLTVRQLTKAKQREGYLPWYDEQLISKVESFNQVPRPIAQLQLYYEFSHHGLNKHERILKTLPFMIRLLAKDLIRWYTDKNCT
ncbi:hypothetical protein HJG54_19590 [Leptolyngbya sp. NK1-12]|uniref:Uncharacterized protein n=1 Tax=Leptolyngbya sp. NK1-12 TaxID=2547451 RepID=A0AA96WM48_9CYAN|nr:hypothetical protein [Leptolyngbya sp. NK1-12]WNZ24831.1 hypothetical protein HJG54_19590 [Leptolyngbya sp. NK1-12]